MQRLLFFSAFAIACGQDVFLAKQSKAVVRGEEGLKMTLLDLKTGAAALDGSPYGFYFRPSKSGSTKWSMHFQGGGWCNSEIECFGRSMTDLGSSVNTSQRLGSCMCWNWASANPLVQEDCNCLHMIYMDGASFSGYREEPVTVPYSKLILGEEKKLYFRGLRNLDATMDYAFEKLGLANATEMVVSGDSAGGLSTILHTDRIAKRMKEQAPNMQRTLAVANVGFFQDHREFLSATNPYTQNMKYIMSMQNISASDGHLKTCMDWHAATPWLCIIAPYAAGAMETPIYMMNSKFDAWQLSNILRLPCMEGYSDFPWERPTICDDSEQAAANQYATDFLNALFKSTLVKPENGAFITSCVCHDCQWGNITIQNISWLEHVAGWYFGNRTGADAFLIDRDGPNKNGIPENDHCVTFP